MSLQQLYITPYPELPRLSLIAIDTIVASRRKKWASQIEDTIENVHGIGVIWGDAKADNSGQNIGCIQN